MISYLFSIFCAGGFLLGCAILVNAVIQFFGIMNWYDFLMSIKKRSLPKKNDMDGCRLAIYRLSTSSWLCGISISKFYMVR